MNSRNELVILPAILTDTVVGLQYIASQLKGVSTWLHIDIMDSTFVPRQTIPVEDLALLTHDFNVEVHFMVNNPERYLDSCVAAKVRRVIFHVEAEGEIHVALSQFLRAGFEVGLALNPETSISQVAPYLDEVTEVLLLDIHPGAQGQPAVVIDDKIAELRRLKPELALGIDGAVTLSNITQFAQRGVSRFVVGSAIIRHENIALAVEEFNKTIVGINAI